MFKQWYICFLVEMCEMERTIPKAYLELIPLAGHMVMQDQPQDLNVMLKKFISKYFANWISQQNILFVCISNIQSVF